MHPEGYLDGEGTGIVMTAGGEGGTFRGRGIGKFSGPGALSWRGLLLYEMGSGKLSGLNGMAVLFEYEIDAAGNSVGNFYEWK